MIPFLRSPSAIAVANPEPTAPATAGLIIPENKAVPAALPSKGARKGRNISGCPVCGLTVIGIVLAKPCTSIGFMCTNMLSPKRPAFAT